MTAIGHKRRLHPTGVIGVSACVTRALAIVLLALATIASHDCSSHNPACLLVRPGGSLRHLPALPSVGCVLFGFGHASNLVLDA